MEEKEKMKGRWALGTAGVRAGPQGRESAVMVAWYGRKGSNQG